MEDNEFKKRYLELIEAERAGDKIEIDKKKLNLLFTSRSYYEIIFNYLFLEKIGYHFDFGSEVLKKGTILYRIRKLDPHFDVFDIKEWGPNPFKKENRANKNQETAMYFNIMSDVCEMETHLKTNDKYAIARYEVVEDIKVGGFFDNKKDIRMLMAGILFNSFLISPSRGDNNCELFEILDKRYGQINLDDITKEDIIKHNFELPLKLSVLVTRDNTYYYLTNEICDCIKKYYPEGIRYSSCYVPLETIGISSNCYNIVLYEEGIKKIRFMDAKECVFDKTVTSTEVIKTLLDSIDDCNSK